MTFLKVNIKEKIYILICISLVLLFRYFVHIQYKLCMKLLYTLKLKDRLLAYIYIPKVYNIMHFTLFL